MKASNTHLPKACDAWLLPTMVLASFGILIAVGLASFGSLSRVQATNAAPRPDLAMTGHSGRMFRNLQLFARPTDAVRDALMALGAPVGTMDAKDDIAARPLPLIVDPNLSLINPQSQRGSQQPKETST